MGNSKQEIQTTTNLPYPEAGLATLIGNERQVQNFLHLMERKFDTLLSVKLKDLENRLTEKDGNLPAYAKASFWAKQKGGYSVKSFENWAKAEALWDERTAERTWPKSVGLKWLRGE